MDPDGFLEGKRREASCSLSQLPSIPFSKKASQKEVGKGKNEKKRNKYIVKVMDHLSD
jgi:hypothetical protein